MPAIARTGVLPWRASCAVGAAGWAGAHRARDQEAARPHPPARPGRRRAAHHPAGPAVLLRPVLETAGLILRQRTLPATRAIAALSRRDPAGQIPRTGPH